MNYLILILWKYKMLEPLSKELLEQINDYNFKLNHSIGILINKIKVYELEEQLKNKEISWDEFKLWLNEKYGNILEIEYHLEFIMILLPNDISICISETGNFTLSIGDYGFKLTSRSINQIKIILDSFFDKN